MLADAASWSGQITNDGVWWLGGIVAIVLLIVFVGTPLLEQWIKNRQEDTGRGNEEDR